MKQCSFCQKRVYRLAGHGLCAPCYYREKRNGTPDYVKVRKPCSMSGCEALSVAQGLCSKHYKRLQRRGDPDAERYGPEGPARGHPLYDTYRWIRRYSRRHMCEQWADNFWAFVRDVGDRPTAKHTLRRHDATRNYEPGNVYWREPRTDILLTDRAAFAEYQRLYRVREPRRVKAAELKKRFGMSLAEFERMHAAQDGLCAICRKPETARRRDGGGARGLAVDHCHTSGKVRGLLCTGCNAVLGQAKDNIETLEAAIRYLKRHHSPP
jgi:hypothetical protein